MPYVAMCEVKWCDPDTRKTYVVPAGDEVKPPVRPALIRQGTVAYFDVVPGKSWDERMAAEAAPVESAEVPEIAGSPAAAGEVPAASVAPGPVSEAPKVELDIEDKPARKAAKKTTKKTPAKDRW